MEYMEMEECSNNTRDAYIYDIKQFSKIINKDSLDITKKDLLEFKNKLKFKGLEDITINRKICAVNKYVFFLKENYNFSLDVKIKKIKIKEQKYLKDMITKDDYTKLVKEAREKKDMRAVLIFRLLFFSGMRISEMLQMKLNDIGKKTIKVKGKGSKKRDVIIPIELNESFYNYLETRKKTDTKALFTSKNGAMTRQMCNYTIKRYAKLAGIKKAVAKCHNLRHLFCLTCVRDRNMTIDEVADLAGHVDINSTRIYTRRTSEELIEKVRDFKE
ncbi:tyrosine-type recombinase/integrase [Clostridium estertheticum]|uniref:tyrosine-type recombinase/integrase n=1 Tax=Clostridium estertheticum TaxID=238834 RepID=UPI002814FDE6|nr:tyrosine-type recombinase/integrase [Clostridium estertheticum]